MKYESRGVAHLKADNDHLIYTPRLFYESSIHVYKAILKYLRDYISNGNFYLSRDEWKQYKQGSILIKLLACFASYTFNTLELFEYL